MDNNVLHIASLLKRLHDFDISRYDSLFLEKSINMRMHENHIKTLSDYSGFLEDNFSEGELFLNTLKISYSQFFRNSLTFSVLERTILPELIQQLKSKKRKEMRIWSAACAAGQEPYSIAILLEELLSGENEKISYRIFATDISETQMKKSQTGEYSFEEVSNLTLKRVQKWFTKQGDVYTIKPGLRKNIEFSVFDLFDEFLGSPPESIFGDFDLVMCANLMFYYKKNDQEILLSKAANCIIRNGYLITGETERDILIKHGYKEIYPQSAIFTIGNSHDNEMRK
jgi:chemotaxis methyl-accepting protein methylase